MEQLQKLGIKAESSNLIIVYDDTRDIDIGVTTPGKDYAKKIHFPYFKHPAIDDAWVAKDRGDTILASDYSLEEKDSFFTHFFQNTVAKNTPEERKQYILNCKCLTASTAYLKKISLTVANFEEIPYSDQENSIIKRFGNVLEQAYVHFLGE